MVFKSLCSLFVAIFLSCNLAYNQTNTIDTVQISKYVKFKPQALIIPTTLIAYGIIGIESDGLKFINAEIKEEVNENIDEKTTIDDFSQFAPMAAVYALNAAGINGKNNFKDRTIILGTATLIMAPTIYTLKTITKIKRPDGSADNSFPSGHTATAFMGAEFLYQEYKDVSIWYGISGYVIATATGFFRIYNDRHWLTDVAAGAGIGILSTKIAYWIQPFFKEHLFKERKNSQAVIMPFYNGKEYGLTLSFSF
jgi:membrane-associated phospholipid phosphatase